MISSVLLHVYIRTAYIKISILFLLQETFEPQPDRSTVTRKARRPAAPASHDLSSPVSFYLNKSIVATW